jgi:hypothetical protein
LPVIVFSLAAGVSLLSAASREPWAPVDPSELAETASRLDPDAPAEVLFWKVNIDDRLYPDERKVREYVRFKVFEPEKAVNVTRISVASASVDGEEFQGAVEIHARLILPDGTTKEFGKESIHERPLVQSGAEQSWARRLIGSEGTDVNEKFLAVSGIEPGSVLEFQISHSDYNLFPTGGSARIVLQRDIPIRQLVFTQQICRDDTDYFFRSFAVNRGQAEIHSDPKAHALVLTAHDLPALVREPFSGAVADYALTYFCAYRSQNTTVLSHHASTQYIQVDPKSGPWAGYATKMFMFEEDLTGPDSQIRGLAGQLTAGAPSNLEKAIRIHNFVQDLHIRFLQSPRPRILVVDPDHTVRSLGQVLEFEKFPDVEILPDDFQWLAIALYRSAGLQAQSVLLPNRGISHFNPRMVAEMFLPAHGVRVLVDGQWQISDPELPTRIPFGMLPWQYEGQIALVAEPNKQEFIDVPLTPAEKSVITNSGDFRLDSNGYLTGDCKRTYTGHCAENVRVLFRRANAAREQAILRRILANEFKPANIRVTSVTGADDPDVPLVVAYQMRYRDFAVLTADRIIFRPSVFHASSLSPFSLATRQYNVEFPYPWQESDVLTIQIPEGYKLESKTAPPSYPGDVLSYRCDMSYEPGNGKIHVQREFVSKVIAAPVAVYGDLKNWYDSVAANDQHELVLIRLPGTAVQPAKPEPEEGQTGPEPDDGQADNPAL